VLEPLYTIKIQCVCCERAYGTSRVRQSFQKGDSHDSDFCAYYKEGHNPDYMLCELPDCGFASTENSMAVLMKWQRKLYREKLGSKLDRTRLRRQRTWSRHAELQAALLCAQDSEGQERIIAGLLQHIAWLYRYKDDSEQEQRFLRYALDS